MELRTAVRMFLTAVAIACVLVLAVACGGGGDDPAARPPDIQELLKTPTRKDQP